MKTNLLIRRLISRTAGTPALVERRTALMERRTPALTVRRATTVLPTARRAAAELGIADSIQQLKTLNDDIQQLTADRNDERAQKTTAELKQARLVTDQAFRDLVLMVNAQAIVTNYDPQAAALNLIYCDLIRSTQETIRYYRQLSDDRRRQNRRVSVKSDIVGNHLYQTAAGWTWARLIQDGKALLAIDEDNPDRIVSTDKKALQLGGRQVALDGQPVRPTDEVNVAKKYQLIALE